MSLAFFDGAHLLMYGLPLVFLLFLGTLLSLAACNSMKAVRIVAVVGSLLTVLAGLAGAAFLDGIHTGFGGEGPSGARWVVVATGVLVAFLALGAIVKAKHVR